jgi:4-diphosphocytidyl-2-C-methyl-D-erythritol kinase
VQRQVLAPAKVNLFLHVGRTGDDGYHPLSSWMVFADIGDQVSIAPAEEMGFEVDGPFAAGVPLTGDNLVLRARDLLLTARAGNPEAPEFRILAWAAAPATRRPPCGWSAICSASKPRR